MPNFETSTEWYEQSSLLLKARPTTARITSKYSVLKPSASKVQKRQKYLDKRKDAPKPPSTSAEASTSLTNPEELVATFTLKTYDPVSGTCLQYETNKAAEVGRLIGSLGRLSKHMAALPEVAEDLSAPAEGAGISTPKLEVDGDVRMSSPAPGAEQKAGGGKKKKKGKK
ncbi:signal recognition particle 9 kDa protein-domain-containing protein [Lophiotrema nucula]|uniref:Signal recognition particle 9 kDa protein-domain-containing protein n=1 Tax=Lophiotrema nucula TaxID=690887 RepID=A0A6A5YXC9_9PLEO|nr:signal recognition particle 9 kDa protein-domain-containing protein [Lophiotrema nucula]